MKAVEALRRGAVVITVSLAAPAAGEMAAKAAEFESFASTILYLDAGASPENVTCYLSNASGKTVRVKDLRVLSRPGERVPLDANTCGRKSGFDLAAGSACYIGTTQIGAAAQGFGCAALVTNGAALRGEVELRDASGRVQASGDMTPPPPGATPSGFSLVASPPMFGAPDQTSATCLFTNVGSKPAKIRKAEFVSSTGDIIVPQNVSVHCASEDGVVTAPPGASCLLNAAVPRYDFQCRAEVSRRPDIRGAMAIIRPGSLIPNFLPLG